MAWIISNCLACIDKKDTTGYHVICVMVNTKREHFVVPKTVVSCF